MPTTRIQFTRGASVALALRIGAALTTLGAVLVHTRWLSQAGYGILVQATAASVLAANLLALGMRGANLQLLPPMVSEGDRARWHGLRQWGLRRTGRASAAVGLLWCGLALATGRDPTWALAGLILPPLTALLLLQTHALAVQAVALAQGPAEIARPLAGLAAFALLAALSGGASPAAAMGGLWLSTVLVCAGMARRTRTLLPAPEGPVVEEPARWRRIARDFLALDVSRIALDHADILIVGAVLGPESAAIFAVCTRLGNLLLFALGAVNTIAAPLVSGLHARGRRAEVQEVLRLGVLASSLLALVGAVALGVYAGPILGLFGRGYAEGRLALGLLLPGYAVNAACGSAGLVVSMTGHQHVTSRIFVGAAVALLVLDAALVPGFGLAGAAAARSLAMIGWNLGLAAYATLRLEYDPSVFSVLPTRGSRRR